MKHGINSSIIGKQEHAVRSQELVKDTNHVSGKTKDWIQQQSTVRSDWNQYCHIVRVHILPSYLTNKTNS